MSTGRPREFDLDQALDRALQVFWKKGYEGTSLPDLTEAMGINRPSLYAAFGNKEALFRKAMDRYVAGPACHVRDALAEPTARRVVERLLARSIELMTDPSTPCGCFMVQGALAVGNSADPLRQEMAKRRAAAEAALCERFTRALAEGDLPPGSNPGDLARYIATLNYGMSVQAAGGATRDELLQVAELVLQSWPS